MKFGTLIFHMAVVMFAGVVSAKEMTTYPLITTESGKAVVIAGTRSPDGRYAVAWTIRVFWKDAPPVDWSLWDAKEPWRILDHYHLRNDWDQHYQVVNLLADLRTGKTVDLPFGGNLVFQSRISAWWGSQVNGRRSALVKREASIIEPTVWLVSVDDRDMSQHDISEAIEKAIGTISSNRRPGLYCTPLLYLPSPGKKGGFAEFRADTVDIPFRAECGEPPVPWLAVDGVVSVNLADGTVALTTSGAKRWDPLREDADIKKAEWDCEEARKALTGKYTTAGFQRLPSWVREQEDIYLTLRWRDTMRAIGKAAEAGQNVRAAEKAALLKAIGDRTAELKRDTEEPLHGARVD